MPAHAAPIVLKSIPRRRDTSLFLLQDSSIARVFLALTGQVIKVMKSVTVIYTRALHGIEGCTPSQPVTQFETIPGPLAGLGVGCVTDRWTATSPSSSPAGFRTAGRSARWPPAPRVAHFPERAGDIQQYIFFCFWSSLNHKIVFGRIIGV